MSREDSHPLLSPTRPPPILSDIYKYGFYGGTDCAGRESQKNRFRGKYPNLERQQLKRGLKRARGGV
jgi:hypothetical protein